MITTRHSLQSPIGIPPSTRKTLPTRCDRSRYNSATVRRSDSGYCCFAPTYGLSNFEALKLRMFQIERAGCLVSSASMRLSELLGCRPRLECRFALPNGMRRIKRVALCLRPLEQVKFHKARHAVEIGFAAEPNLLEGFLGATFYLEAIHGNEH